MAPAATHHKASSDWWWVQSWRAPRSSSFCVAETLASFFILLSWYSALSCPPSLCSIFFLVASLSSFFFHSSYVAACLSSFHSFSVVASPSSFLFFCSSFMAAGLFSLHLFFLLHDCQSIFSCCSLSCLIYLLFLFSSSIFYIISSFFPANGRSFSFCSSFFVPDSISSHLFFFFSLSLFSVISSPSSWLSLFSLLFPSTWLHLLSSPSFPHLSFSSFPLSS